MSTATPKSHSIHQFHHLARHYIQESRGVNLAWSVFHQRHGHHGFPLGLPVEERRERLLCFSL